MRLSELQSLDRGGRGGASRCDSPELKALGSGDGVPPPAFFPEKEMALNRPATKIRGETSGY